MLIGLDLLQDADGTVLADEPLKTRRKRLEAFGRKYFPKRRGRGGLRPFLRTASATTRG